MRIVSPVYYDYAFERKFLDENVHHKKAVAINLGSGNSRLSPDIANVDIFAYPEVDLVCNLENIPILSLIHI